MLSALLLVLGLPATAGGLLDQQCDGGNGFAHDLFNANCQAQTFTAGLSGTLTTVELRLYTEDGVPGDAEIVVEIRNTTAGDLPGTGVLGSATILASDIVDYEFRTVSFPPGTIPIEKGTLYAIVLRTDRVWSAGGNFGTNGGYPDSTYAGGTAWQSSDGLAWTPTTAGAENCDRHFRTRVDPYIPRDPEAVFIAVIAVLDSDLVLGSTEPWAKDLIKAKRTAEQALALYRESPDDQVKIIKSLAKTVKSVLSAERKGYADDTGLPDEIGWFLGLNLATLAKLDAEGVGADPGLLVPAEEWIDLGNAALHGGDPLPAMNDYAKSAKISQKVRKKTR
jgi:hypothetical protein